MGSATRTRGIQNPISNDFGVFFGLNFEGFLGTEDYDSVFFGVASRSLDAPTVESKSGRLALLKQGCGTEVVAKICFT